MTKRKTPLLFPSDSDTSYFSVQFKPLTDPCWVHQVNGTLIIGDWVGDSLDPAFIYRLMKGGPIAVVLQERYGTSFKLALLQSFLGVKEDDETSSEDVMCFQVTENYILSVDPIPTPKVQLEGVDHELVILPNGSIEVGCHTLTPTDVRRTFVALAEFFEYDLEDWEVEVVPVKGRKNRSSGD